MEDIEKKLWDIEDKIFDVAGVEETFDKSLLIPYIEQIEAIIKEYQNNAHAWQANYFAYSCLKDFDETLNACNMVLKLSPEDINTHTFKISLLQSEMRYADCIEACKNLILCNSAKRKDIKYAISEWEDAYEQAEDSTLEPPPNYRLNKVLRVITYILLVLFIVGVVYFCLDYENVMYMIQDKSYK